MEASNRQPTAAARAWAAAAVAIAVNGLERGRRATALTRGILPQCRSAVESSSSREAGRRPGSSATSLAPICGIGRCRLLPLARPFAVDVTECGAGDYAERSGPHPHPRRLCSFHASLRSVRPSVHAPSLSVVSLSSRSDCKMPANSLPSLPSFLPSILFPVDISPLLLLLLLPSSEAAKFSSPSAAPPAPLSSPPLSVYGRERG